mgnify:CR=1 FL=1
MTGLSASPAPASGGASSQLPKVLLFGNPNVGKSSLFNLLSGGRAKISNYPGSTVQQNHAALALPSGKVELVDLPGTYSLRAHSIDESVAIRALYAWEGQPPAALLLVLDATTLRRGLYLATQLAESGLPLVVALNMMDEAESKGIAIDLEGLSRLLGVPVVPTVAKSGKGRVEVLKALEQNLAERKPVDRAEPLRFRAETEALLAPMEQALRGGDFDRGASARRLLAQWFLLSAGRDEGLGMPPALMQQLAPCLPAGSDLAAYENDLIESRYREVDRIVDACVRSRSLPQRRAAKLDALLTHPLLGVLIFIVTMLLMFEALFSWSEPLVSGIESLVEALQAGLVQWMPAGPLRDLLSEGVVAGVGNVLVFVPQIALLFLLLGFLDDSGYLARAAFLADRVMSSVGLHGKAFVALLSGFGCAVPAVLATRSLESRRDRLLTMLVLPLMSCSARLPVYILIISTVFPRQQRLFGLVSEGSLMMMGLYAFSILSTLGAAALLGRTLFRGPAPTFLLEMPPLRLPQFTHLLRQAGRRVLGFVREAGTIILALTIVIWALLAFPKSEAVERDFAARRQRLESQGATSEAQQALAREEASAQLAHSFGGRLGKALEPLVAPLGFDWRITLGVVGSFTAREVFVSTLGIVFGSETEDDEGASLRERLREAKRPNGEALMTPLVGVSLMVFFVLACQCMSTLAVVRRESGSWKWPLFMFAYMSVFAYGAALLVYQLGRWAGWA